jgi:hypothetical protein
MPNWYDINRCPVWKVLGVMECKNCDTVKRCWGEDAQCVVDCEFCPYPCSSRGMGDLLANDTEICENGSKQEVV